MRSPITLVLGVALVAMLAGCSSGPEKKLARGFRNTMEFTRMGEIRRSIEQTALWDSPDKGYSTGFIKGFNRSMARTGIGIYEILTFPFPSYDPIKPHKYPDKLTYPDSYKPSLISDQIFSTDTYLGFGGGDVAPHIPGSRFRIFDN